MASQVKRYAQLFDAQSLRERALIAAALLAVFGFTWWIYLAEPALQRTDQLQQETQRIRGEVEDTGALVAEIRARIGAGVHQQKEAQLARLLEDLAALEERLRVTTIELIDPEKMFALMNQLLYRDSKLQLLGLKRREVRAAIPPDNPEDPPEEPSIYRHVLEIEFAGSYLDILRYIQSLEALDWKLLWDEIEINSGEYPQVTVKVSISTLSTRREWVGI